VRIQVLLIAGAAVLALLACDGATGPDTAVPSADEAAQLASAAASPMSEGTIVHRVNVVSEGEFIPLGWCDEAGGVMYAGAPGAGNMTHVGRFGLQQAGCVDLTTGLITGGQGVISAANGDEIHVTYSGRILPGVVPQTMELSYVGIGGTGRFAHAVSEVSVLVIYTSETTWVSEGGGWLSYSASDRSDR
jgi:hypothetical protein